MAWITPKQILGARLEVRRWHEGYDTGQVDDLLDSAAESLETVWLLRQQSEARAHRLQAELAACRPVRAGSRVSYAGRTVCSHRGRGSVWASR